MYNEIPAPKTSPPAEQVVLYTLSIYYIKSAADYLPRAFLPKASVSIIAS